LFFSPGRIRQKKRDMEIITNIKGTFSSFNLYWKGIVRVHAIGPTECYIFSTAIPVFLTQLLVSKNYQDI
jgi:hypothetical protein